MDFTVSLPYLFIVCYIDEILQLDKIMKKSKRDTNQIKQKFDQDGWSKAVISFMIVGYME